MRSKRHFSFLTLNSLSHAQNSVGRSFSGAVDKCLDMSVIYI